MPLRRLLAISLAAGLIGGCSREGSSETAAAPAATGQEASHIHGVGVNPADDAVMIATHSGLVRSPSGSTRAARIGDRRQDTMGFTVVGPDHFLGSGHPDLRDDLPPLLGLIRSTDGGRSWDPVSLLGQADFHVLRAAGNRIYGVNSADARLLVSSDGGRRWEPRTPPGAIFDLAIEPGRPDRVVVSTDQGLFASADTGRKWRPLDRELAGLLAWSKRLVLIDGGGAVHASGDGGRTFEQLGNVGAQPAALGTHEELLLAALHDNSVHVSRDGGRTWAIRVG